MSLTKTEIVIQNGVKIEGEEMMMCDEPNHNSQSNDMDTSSVTSSVVTKVFNKPKRQWKWSESSRDIDPFVGASDEDIIQHYASNQLEYVRRSYVETDRGKYIIAQTKAESATTEETANACIKTLSQHLSPAQQRLAAALLHPPQLSCKFNNCSENFVFEEHLESHSKLHGEFSCTLCSHVETYAPKLVKHVLTEHVTTITKTKDSNLFVLCPIPTCAAVVPAEEFHKSNYAFHYLTKHLNLDVSSIDCVICHYSNPTDLPSRHHHFHTFHGIFNMKPEDVRPCDSCPAFFCDAGKLNLHMMTFHNQFPTSCPYCKKALEGRNGYKKHRRNCKGVKNTFQHQCSFPNCNAKFEYESALTVHMKTCTFNPQGSWHGCTKCKKRFQEKEQLLLHMESKHSELEESWKEKRLKKRTCGVCGKEVKAQIFSKHMRIHAGPDSWKHECLEPGCGKKFHSANILKKHLRTHTKDRPFPCELCHARYNRRKDLTKHVLKKHGSNDEEMNKGTPQEDNPNPASN